MQKTLKGEPLPNLQSNTAGELAPKRSGHLSAIGAALRFLTHLRTRRGATAETSTETGQARGPDRDPTAYQSPMEAGITGGFSLLTNDRNARKRR